MSDITMCQDEQCPKHQTCYRYLADVNEYRQAYFAESPRDIKTNECDHYWECCQYCKGREDYHKISCPTQKIVVNLNQ